MQPGVSVTVDAAKWNSHDRKDKSCFMLNVTSSSASAADTETLKVTLLHTIPVKPLKHGGMQTSAATANKYRKMSMSVQRLLSVNNETTLIITWAHLVTKVSENTRGTEAGCNRK